MSYAFVFFNFCVSPPLSRGQIHRSVCVIYVKSKLKAFNPHSLSLTPLNPSLHGVIVQQDIQLYINWDLGKVLHI